MQSSTNGASDLSPQPGDIFDGLEVTDLTVDGKGVARQSGRVVFLDDALPGAVVDARVTLVKKNIVEEIGRASCRERV